MSTKKISIIIPCYNEELTISSVIDELHSILPQTPIYVFDNNSTDKSKEIISAKAKQQNGGGGLQLFEVKQQGKGQVIKEAFSLIDSDIYIIIDGDGEHDPSILPQALSYFLSHSLDMLNISRRGDKNLFRKGHHWGNRLFNKITQFLFGNQVEDMLSGYRIFSKAFVKTFPAQSNGFEIETELTIFALQQQMKIGEISAPYRSRPEGSFSKLSTFRDGFKILLMIIKLLFLEKPLSVFGFFGLLCFAISTIMGIPIITEYIHSSQVPRFPTLFSCIGLGIVGFICVITGFLSHLIVRSIKENRYLAYLRYKK